MVEPLNIGVIAATSDQEPVLANLLELYAHDFSEFHNIELGPDGRFGYKDLPLYWREPGRWPFLVRVDGRLAGLVLVKQVWEGAGGHADDAGIWDMAEFFIVRRYRGSGLGMRVAHQIWAQFPGPWQIRVMASNQGGRIFWERAIVEFAGPDKPALRIG